MSDHPSAGIFDSLAKSYDTDFSERMPAQRLRAAVYDKILPLLHPGTQILELGCGTGIDAVWFARRGCQVWATDGSEQMLAAAGRRVDENELGDRVRLERLDLNALDQACVPGPAAVDLIFSNFGALNCVQNLGPLFAMAERRLQPGGHLAVTIMGRFCLWETIYFLARGRAKAAVRRWKGHAPFDVDGARITVSYHSPGKLMSLAPRLRPHMLYGIGSFLPTSEAFHLFDRSPRMLKLLERCEAKFGKKLARISDHYLLTLQKPLHDE